MAFFFVHMIESPSPDDLLKSQWEGTLLREALRIAGISQYYNLAVNKETFLEAIRERLSDAIKNYGFPVLHISAHGDIDGLALTNGTFIKWKEMRELLIPLNKAMKGKLLICISSCEGFAGCRMAMEIDGERPFYALCGPTGKPTWAESAIAFMTFYYHLSKKKTGPGALSAMKVASGYNGFELILGKQAKDMWIEQWSKLTPADIRRIALESKAFKSQ